MVRPMLLRSCSCDAIVSICNLDPTKNPDLNQRRSTGLFAGIPGRTMAPLLLVTFLATGGWMTTLSFLSSFAANEFDVGIWSAALIIMAIHTGSFTIGGALSLRVVNRWGSKVTYCAGNGVLALYMIVLGLTQNLILGIPLGLVAGLGLAMHWTGFQNYVIEVAPAKHRGQVSGTVSFVMVGAIGLSGLALGFATDDGGFARFIAVTGSMVGMACVLALRYLPNLGPATPGTALSGNVFAGFRDPSLRRMAYVRSAHAAAYALFNLMAGPRLYEAGGGLEYVGLLAFSGSMAGGVAQLVVGRMSDLFGRTGLLNFLLAMAVLACVGFVLADNIYLLLLVTSLHWFTQIAFQTLLVALGGDLSPPGQSANAMAMLTVSFSFGIVGGSLYVGLLSTTAWPNTGFLITAGLLAAALIAVYRMRAALTRIRAMTM